MNGLLMLWSAPRSRSTAFERMMRERGDFTVVHEPFSLLTDYGSTTVDGRQITSERELISALLASPGQVFAKDTTDFHYAEVLADQEFLSQAQHTFIIRHPSEAIASHYALNPKLGRDEVGFAWLYEIFAAVQAATGRDPVVVDSDDLLAKPQETVAAYCRLVGIEHRPESLQWQPGLASGWQRSERWHADTRSTSTFEAREQRYEASVENSPYLAELLDYHLPYYEKLREYAISVD